MTRWRSKPYQCSFFILDVLDLPRNVEGASVAELLRLRGHGAEEAGMQLGTPARWATSQPTRATRASCSTPTPGPT